jgi:thiol-disulfide isomerase/thioredoxin
MKGNGSLASKSNSRTKDGKEVVAKKGHGLSKAEKIAIPIIIIIAAWAVYSALNPGTSTGGSSSLSITNTTSVSQAGQAPDFTLPVVGPNGETGQTLTLSSFRGKVVLLEFMEPWCPHCQNMAPVLDSLYTKYQSGNVVFLSVAGPWNGATASDAAGFISKYGTSWTYVYDSSGTIFSEYGVNSTPTFYVIGANGAVSASFTGEQTSDVLAGAISAAGGT